MSSRSQLRILVLGHSFVWRLAKFTMEANLPCIAHNFHCAEPAVIQFYGIGGRTVTKLRQLDLSLVAQFNPAIIILEIGSNDLCDPSLNANDLATNIFYLVQTLHFSYKVHHILVSQVLPRRSPPRMIPSYNTRVTQLMRLLNHFLRVTPFATLWFHPKILRTQSRVFLRDGVHLNFLGNHFPYHSYQKALLYCLSRNRDVFPNSRSFFIRRPRCNRLCHRHSQANN